MVQISEPWIDPKRDRPKWLVLQGGEALVGMIEKAHQGLLGTSKQESASRKELAAIQRQQAGIDTDYDRMIRGGFPLLTALAELSEKEAEREALLKARDELFPHGLVAIQRSYTDEAGEISLAEARLSADSIAVLKKIKILGGNFWTVVVERWFQWGKELGALEEKKRALEAAAAGKDALGVARSEALKARNFWIKVVRHLETAVEIAELDAEGEEAMLGALRSALKKSARKSPIDEAADEEPT